MKRLLSIFLLINSICYGQGAFVRFTRTERPLVVSGGGSWTPPVSIWHYFENTGMSVSQWTDQSSNHFDLVQATGGNQPTLSSNIFSFTSAQYLRYVGAPTASTAYSIYVIVRVANWSSAAPVFFRDNAFGTFLYISGGNAKFTASGGGTYLTTSVAGLTNSTFAIIQAYYDGAGGSSSYIRVNALTANTGTAGSGNISTNVNIGDPGGSFANSFDIEAYYFALNPTGGANGADDVTIRARILSNFGL